MNKIPGKMQIDRASEYTPLRDRSNGAEPQTNARFFEHIVDCCCPTTDQTEPTPQSDNVLMSSRDCSSWEAALSFQGFQGNKKESYLSNFQAERNPVQFYDIPKLISNDDSYVLEKRLYALNDLSPHPLFSTEQDREIISQASKARSEEETGQPPYPPVLEKIDALITALETWNQIEKK